MRIDESLPVAEYFRRSMRTPDGAAWLLVCVASLLCLVDLWSGFGLVPLGYRATPGKAAALLIAAPLIGFVNLVRQRQGMFNERKPMAWFRAVICIGIFIVFNF